LTGAADALLRRRDSNAGGAKRIITNGDEAAVILHYAHGVWSIYKP